jgi:RNA polymerase sigma-70 factor (ECF subfamily)
MEELRTSLILYSYNILGSYEEAKDIVQDVFLKFTQLDQNKVEDQKLYLIRMVVNLSIDQKRKQKKLRENYPGQWLPEPLTTEDPETSIHRKEILSYSLMVLLEKLDSKQRAVFILKEAFDYDHEEIARVLGISVENSRKILSRAKIDLQSDSSASPVKKQDAILQRYLRIMEKGDMKALEQFLNQDVTVLSDGGGKATAFMKPVHGVRSVSALLAGLYKKSYKHARFELGWVNYQPALFYYSEDKLVTCQIFSMKDNAAEHIFFIRNPEKMASLSKIL